MTFKEEALRKLFVFIKDTNTEKIKRTVVPAELQVGLYDNPTSLDIFGRLAINSVEYTVNKQNDSGIIHLKNHDTLASINTELTLSHVDVYLPAKPRNGQVHFIKDGTATATRTPINIYPSSIEQTIDGQSSVTLDTNYGSLAIAWVQNEWRQIVAGANSTSGAPTNATYVTINNESSLSNERALAGSSNVTVTDNGAGSDVELDLSNTGVTAGVYTLPFLSIDAKGRITAAANGAGAFAPSGAEYLVLSADGTLSDERIFSASTGLIFVDNGAGSSFVVSIDDSVVATLSGSIFSGPVVAQGGLSGSLQNLSDGTSYLVAGANVTITSGSSGQVIISAATSASIGSGADEEATYLVVSLTSSLPNERAVSSSFGLRITDGGAGSTFDFAVSDDEIATLTGSIFRGDVKFNAGLSGSLQNLVDGSSYLVAGANVTITTQSNGQVEIAASSGGGGGGSGDTDATYIVISNTSSLNAERQLEVGTGLILSDSGANSSVTISADDNVLATLTGSLFSGPVQANGGLSGSLQNLVSGESYLVAGTNITITTESNGQVTISSTASGGGSSTTGWETAYEIDFTTLSAVTASTSTVSIDGYTWNVENLANADFIGVIPGTGLQVDPNANSSDYYTNIRTSPLIWISIQSLVPDYDPTIDDLRVFVNLELTGSNANFEIASTALTKLPYPGNTTQFSHQFFRGYAGGSFTSSRSFLGNTIYSGISAASSSSAGLMVLSHNYTNFGVYGLDYDYVTYSFPTGSVKQNLGNFNLRGSTAGYQTIRFEYEPEIAFEFAAFPVNTANSFQATIRHLLIQRKR